jgi:antitoxin ParD1/3/4
MNVELSPELEKIVVCKVQAGRYSSAEDLLQEAIELIDQRDQLIELTGMDMEAEIEEGLESLRLEEAVDGDSFFDEMEARLRALDGENRKH